MAINNGIRTTNLDRQFAIDELIGNITVDGVAKTARIPKEALVNQLAASGPFVFGNTVYALTKPDLDAVAPANEQMGGIVLTGAHAGYYARKEGGWAFGRGFADTLASVVLSGPANAQIGTLGAGVDPADVVEFRGIVETDNTGPMTLQHEGDVMRPVVNAAGNALSAGEWTGTVKYFIDDDGNFRLSNDPGSAQASAQSASEAADTLAEFLTHFLGNFADDTAAATAAGTPVEGQFYWNTTSKVFRYFDGAAWQAFPYATVADGSVTDAKLYPGSYAYNKRYERNIFDFIPFAMHADILAGTSTDDHLAYLQAAADSGLCVFLPPYTFNVSDELVIKDGTKLVGAGANWKRRTGFSESEGRHTRIKYIGLGGDNTCVVRVSELAVGTQGSDFSAPGTDDLVNFILRDIHVDSNELADFGWYIYRAGNNSDFGNLTAEKAVKRNILMMGIYAYQGGHFGAYECGTHGVSVGEDYFAWGTAESTCFDFTATFHLVNNGADATYEKGTGTDMVESGGIFTVGRGSHITICSEGNFGRACIIRPRPMADSTDGPVFYNLSYLEGNGDGPYVYYYPGSRGHVIREGFVHPGNAASPGSDRFSGTLQPQDIKIRSYTNAGVETADQGPSDEKQWLTLERLVGMNQGVAFGIDANTYKFHTRDCTDGIVYAAKLPTPEGVFAQGVFTPSTTIAVSWAKGCTVQRQGTGHFRVLFNPNCPDALYHARAAILSGSTLPNRAAYAGGYNAGYFDIFVFDTGTGSLTDTGSFNISFSAERIGPSRG